MLGIKDKNKIITITSELIKTFNPVLYSIDTFCEEKLKDLKYGSLEKITIHQIVYGWYKEKSVLDSFIDNFYQDNASRILRIDMIMYTVIVYLALFRIDELGVDIFKDYLLSQDPSKMIVFVSYLYNEENYNGCLKAEWMKSRDLSYIENDIISKIELFKPYSQLFLYELEQRALGIEAKLAAKDAEIKAGTFGVPQVNKKAITRPRSPNLTKPKLPYIPEPEKIEQIFNVNDKPIDYNKTNLAILENKHIEQLNKEREIVNNKYDNTTTYHYQEDIESDKFNELKHEIENSRINELDFNHSYTNPIPNYNNIPSNIKLNVSTILREDYLFRKQQEKDIQILKKYEEELRDPLEYYTWQEEMKEKDEIEKLNKVNTRRNLSKQSTIDAKNAMTKQIVNNQLIGNLIRKQENIIKQHKQIDNEIDIINKQTQAKEIAIIRDNKPKEAKNKIITDKIINNQLLKNDLINKKIEYDELIKQENELRADKIRQLKAVNTIHKKTVKIFDPTEISGQGFLDEMSYLEMKSRLEQQQKELIEIENKKRDEIIVNKSIKTSKIQEKLNAIQTIRSIKSNHTKKLLNDKKSLENEKKLRNDEIVNKSSSIIYTQLIDKQTKLNQDISLVKEKENKIKNELINLKSSMIEVEKMKYDELLLAKERQIKTIQNNLLVEQKLINQTKSLDQTNSNIYNNKLDTLKKNQTIEYDNEYNINKEISYNNKKLLNDKNKLLNQLGREQFERTKSVVIDHNPYANKITRQVHENSINISNTLRKTSV